MPPQHALGRCGCLAAVYYELERHLAGHTTAEVYAAESAELLARHWNET